MMAFDGFGFSEAVYLMAFVIESLCFVNSCLFSRDLLGQNLFEV